MKGRPLIDPEADTDTTVVAGRVIHALQLAGYPNRSIDIQPWVKFFSPYDANSNFVADVIRLVHDGLGMGNGGASSAQ